MSMFRRFVFAPPGEGRTEWAIAGLRIFFGLMMALGHGTNKFPVSAGWVRTVAELGFPFPVVFAWAATLAELVGGFMLAAGLLTRFAALAILFTMGIATFMVNWGSGNFGHLEIGLVYGVVAVFFLIYGGGKKSIDGMLSR